MIDERIEVTPMIGIDSHIVYNFGYPLFRSLPDLTTEINSFNDLNKIRHFLLNCSRYLNWSHTTHLDINEREPFEEAALTQEKLLHLEYLFQMFFLSKKIFS